MNVFNAYSEYYDLLYNSKNYGEETAYVDALIKKYSQNSRTILELGCGTGLHASLLAEKGFEVHGIDRSKTMLEKAAARKQCSEGRIAEKLSFDEADIRSYRVDRKFDVAISLFHVMSYMQTELDLEQAFLTAKNALVKNGLFIFDCWHGPGVLKDPPISRTKHFTNEHVEITRISTPVHDVKKNTVDVNFDISIRRKETKQTTKLQELHTMRYLFTDEIKELLHKTGLELITAEEWLTGKTLSENTWNACYVCKNK